jgi:molybdopterin biosynthesis enzyme
MMNYSWRPVSSVLPLKEDFSRKSSDRMTLVPVKITGDGFVQTVDYHGSAHITALAEADGIITVPAGVKKLEKGTILTFRQI